MRRCLQCESLSSAFTDTCPECGSTTLVLKGFPAYAPELSRRGGGFEEKFFHHLAPLEASNFWFRARNELILWALKSYCPQFNRLLEIGCGTGFVLSGIAQRYPEASLSGSELFIEGLSFAASRLRSVELMQMDARRIPFTEEFDVVGAFDVLEHIEEDTAVLSQIHTSLKPGGHLIITVPQHRWLWSSVDDYSHHVRRYTAQELHHKVKSAGFHVVRSTSFVSLLLPLLIASRFSKRGVPADKLDPLAEYHIPRFINLALLSLLRVERAILRIGTTLHVGGSRLVVARKP
jgi:SAM-dependent methyltransferase